MMRKPIVASLAALVLAATTSTAGAAPATPSPDAVCLAVFLNMTGTGDAEGKNAGVMGSLYFVGRVEGANPGKDALGLVIEILGRPDAAQLIAAAALGCYAQMRALGEHWIARGEELKAAGMGAP